ncbi:MAG TPA: hypothetical protein VN956_17050 [Pyrinomonadaceae bacterium]|nr:hypothetical protein [Pyrinomonadaceae bacterium]
MTTKKKQSRRKLSDEEIDRTVETQAADNFAWGKPIQVRKKRSESVSLPAELAARVAFLAQLHRERNAQEWLARIIKERVELEEVAFLAAKREMFTRNGV